MASTENNNLETLLSDDPDGVERDKLAQVLKTFELELDAALKRGCAPDEYQQIGIVLAGTRVAQSVLQDYHRYLNDVTEG